jgi:hypothetical protein
VLAEIVFAMIMRKVIRRGNFTSVSDLTGELLRFIGYFNEVFAKPFRWTFTGRPLQKGYSHRVAIANSHLLALEDGQLFFRWKDYADDQRTKVMRLTADQFIRRFLLHVLPKRFRHYGLLAGRNVRSSCRTGPRMER